MTLTQPTVVNCIAIGFQRGTYTRRRLVANDGTGALALTDMGESFGIAMGGVLTLFIAAPPNGSSICPPTRSSLRRAVHEQRRHPIGTGQRGRLILVTLDLIRPVVALALPLFERGLESHALAFLLQAASALRLGWRFTPTALLAGDCLAWSGMPVLVSHRSTD